MAGRDATPTLGIIDSRSIKSSHHVDTDIAAAKKKLNAEFKVVLRPERSFAWLENFRRIAMDYEFYADTGVAMVQMAFIRLMLNKIIDIN